MRFGLLIIDAVHALDLFHSVRHFGLSVVTLETTHGTVVSYKIFKGLRNLFLRLHGV
jgi:hypothetical protein